MFDISSEVGVVKGIEVGGAHEKRQESCIAS